MQDIIMNNIKQSIREKSEYIKIEELTQAEKIVLSHNLLIDTILPKKAGD